MNLNAISFSMISPESSNSPEPCIPLSVLSDILSGVRNRRVVQAIYESIGLYFSRIGKGFIIPIPRPEAKSMLSQRGRSRTTDIDIVHTVLNAVGRPYGDLDPDSRLRLRYDLEDLGMDVRVDRLEQTYNR